jgi:chromate transport protein ChrA
LLVAFLKIGSIGFGGGKAVIALMEQEFARERRLISVDEFVHGVALGQILGPFSANAAIFIGYRLYGLLGGLLCAVAFLVPSVVLGAARSSTPNHWKWVGNLVRPSSSISSGSGSAIAPELK